MHVDDDDIGISRKEYKINNAKDSQTYFQAPFPASAFLSLHTHMLTGRTTVITAGSGDATSVPSFNISMLTSGNLAASSSFSTKSDGVLQYLKTT